MEDYPCPECGSDGPHTVVDHDENGVATFECGACYAEFRREAD